MLHTLSTLASHGVFFVSMLEKNYYAIKRFDCVMFTEQRYIFMKAHSAEKPLNVTHIWLLLVIYNYLTSGFFKFLFLNCEVCAFETFLNCFNFLQAWQSAKASRSCGQIWFHRKTAATFNRWNQTENCTHDRRGGEEGTINSLNPSDRLVY